MRNGRSGRYYTSMIIPFVQDLAKPKWVAMLKALKASDGMAMSDLARAIGLSYMGASQIATDLTKLGYLQRIRMPRTAVGRPEITYRISPKYDEMFSPPGVGLALEMLETSRRLFGENAPERMIFQHFENLRERWRPKLAETTDLLEKASQLAALRTAYGAICQLDLPDSGPPRLVERHHPLKAVMAEYPSAVAMDVRLIEDLLGTRVQRSETHNGKSEALRVDFAIPAATAVAG